MPRTKQQQSTAPSLTDPAEAALAEGVETRSQGKSRAKPASKKKANAKAEPPKKPKYTRTHALHDALKQGGTRAELTELVDSLYVEQGGTSNKGGAQAMVSLHCPVLKHFGVIEEDEAGRLSLKR